MHLCREARKISIDVCEFIEIAKPNEESITDFIVWKLRRIRSYRTYHVNFEMEINSFTRQQEGIKGADLEIVFIDRIENLSLSLLIQAKKSCKRKGAL